MDTTIFTLLNDLSREIHRNAVAHGFYDGERSVMSTASAADADVLRHAFFAQRIALLISEATEAMEADRKDMWCCGLDGSENSTAIFERDVKDTVEDELADVLIRLLDTCGRYGIDIGEHVRLKMAYNAHRPKMHGKAY